MVSEDALRHARASYERQSWRQAYDLLAAADREAPLGPEDLDRLATCALMLGSESESVDLWAKAHHEFLARGGVEQAAQCAFRIGVGLGARGQLAQASGWLARARRVLDDAAADSAVRGYLVLTDAIRAALAGEVARAHELFSQAEAIGQRFGDSDLIAFGRQGQGRALIRMGRLAEGLALLDEVMVAVTAGELTPLSMGDIYCSVIDACSEIFDLRRAVEWTAALEKWCEAQSDHVPYRGMCLIHRAEILQLQGAWADALGEAERACERLLLPPPRPAAGRACYQRGELHRLRGELDRAEAAYRQASELGRKPQPGLALLRLAQGDIDAALGSIRRAVEGARGPVARSRMLGAFVEILLAANDTESARSAVRELEEIAEELDAPFLRAAAFHCAGAVDLAEGNAERALAALHNARDIWRDLAAPYDEARTRVLVALASRALGDEDTAALELDAARAMFRRLGAVTDVARLEKSARPESSSAAPRLTARELEVLGLVATGKTNRAIADALGLSEKTVARHVANIFTKLGLTSRAAATAYAYRNRLV
jgi:DNA-binding CsgD family transcriptional regulator